MDREIINYSYIQGVAFAKENVPTSFPPHWHDSAEFTLILKKECEYKIGEEIYRPDPGDILFVWSRELHEIKKAPEEGYILLQFSSGLVESSTDIATAIRFLSKFHHISSKKEIIPCRIRVYNKGFRHPLQTVFVREKLFAVGDRKPEGGMLHNCYSREGKKVF